MGIPTTPNEYTATYPDIFVREIQPDEVNRMPIGQTLFVFTVANGNKPKGDRSIMHRAYAMVADTSGHDPRFWALSTTKALYAKVIEITAQDLGPDGRKIAYIANTLPPDQKNSHPGLV